MKRVFTSPHGAHNDTIVCDADTRPSKFRRRGSRILSAIGLLAKSASGTSSPAATSPVEFSPSPTPSTSRPLTRKVSMSFLNIQVPQATVHRTPAKSRVALALLDGGFIEVNPEISSPSSGETSSNGVKLLNFHREDVSTAKTSLDSKFSLTGRVASGRSCEKNPSGEVTLALATIFEAPVTPPPKPSVETLEKAAALKIHLECEYNILLNTSVTPRSLRRRKLEGDLYNNLDMSSDEQDEQRRFWTRCESDYLREIRVIRSRPKVPRGIDRMASKYEVIKVLGKGSFGVVRLVREKTSIGQFTQPSEEKKEVYAMKVIRKAEMLCNSQEGHLRAERDFLVNSEGSRWIIPLIESFQDASNLYLVMEFMPGGDFLGLLIRDTRLSEAVTKWYIAEMILCVEEAHSLRWIHRDIKPDNFLISASGHLKISDFGLAFDGHWSHDQSYYNKQRYSLLKRFAINIEGDEQDKQDKERLPEGKPAQMFPGSKARQDNAFSAESRGDILNSLNKYGIRDLARSVVGTSQYMAPEVIRGNQYDARCDWWSVAIILYECLFGHTPFLAEEGGRQQTKLNILVSYNFDPMSAKDHTDKRENHKETFYIPERPVISRQCQDVLRRIIQDKDDRMCSRRYRMRDHTSVNIRHHDSLGRYVYANDAEDIKSHRWFKDIDWEHLHMMKPPFVPDIKGIDDTHYFDEEDAISDFSSSQEYQADPLTAKDADQILRNYNREIQILMKGYITGTYDTIKLRRIDKEIDGFLMNEEAKESLKLLVRMCGRKEKKRPRDLLLRDKQFAGKVLEIRKGGAFLGYSYRRIRRSRPGLAGIVAGNGKGKGAWHRARLSIH